MGDPRLLRRLDQVGGRLQWLRGLWTATLGWILLGLAVLVLRHFQLISLAWCAVLFGIPTILLATLILASRRRSDRLAAAKLIEQTYPQLDSRLITAVQQQPLGHDWDFSFLQSELLAEVFAQLRRQNWQRAVAGSRLWSAQIAHAAALGLCLSAMLPLVRNWKQFSTEILRGPAETEIQTDKIEIVVEPGDVELERGTSLVVRARFSGGVPGTVELVANDPEMRETRQPLQKRLKDPLFGGRIASVPRNLTYHVEFDGKRSADYRVNVFDFPTLVRANATLDYPDYTRLPEKRLEDVRVLSAVEGSTLTLDCELNLPVTSAELVRDGEEAISLTPRNDQAAFRTAQLLLSTPGDRRYQLRLKDAAGRTNPEPIEFRLTTLPNKVPQLKMTFPARDLRVSPLQELELQANASDDFGIQSFGLRYQLPDGKESTVHFQPADSPNEQVAAHHRLELEGLHVRPDDLISYYFFAEDLGPDGQPRRTMSDLFFAEVRSFEEIFRQQAPSPGQTPAGGPSSESGALLEMQRNVVTAAWNVWRRAELKIDSKVLHDLQTLEQSQRRIQQAATQLKSRVQDELLKQHAEEAVHHMDQAAEAFRQAAEDQTDEQIVAGRNAAQAAYQFLLKLQSRENLVQLAQSGQSQEGGQSANRMNQQLQSLQLKNDRDRYETERQAAPPSSADDNALRIMTQLKDLARRQEDLNNRVRELELAMHDAKDPEERDELRRQLKRLQSEQEELLRDLDNARNQMQQGEQQASSESARKQADEVRERILQSARALEQGETSKALTAGTRAQRQLNQLEEEFRQQTSSQFEEQLRQLREDVRKLAANEEALAKRLNQPEEDSKRPQRTLRDSPEVPEDQLATDFSRQKQALDDVLNQTRQLVEDAETSEPLLSKKLYDTLRSLRKNPPDEALEDIIQFTQQGFREQLADLEQQANSGIRELQSGIEGAAEGILGSDQESLRRAQNEISELSQAIRRELALHDPDSQVDEQSADEPQADSTGKRQSETNNASPEPDASGQRGPSPSEPSRRKPATKDQPLSENELSQNGTSSKESTEKGAANSGPAKQNGTSNQNSPPGTQSSTPDSERGSISQAEEQKSEKQGKASSGKNASSRNSSANSPSQSESADSSGGSGGRDGSSFQPSPNGFSPKTLDFLLGGGRGGMESESEADSGRHAGPVAGRSYQEWSNRMQNVEEMLPTAELRARAAAIRDRVRQARIEVKRHSRQPDWKLVRTSIYGPLLELENDIAEELARRDPRQQLVPIDRDPVPEQYAEFVKKYYEQLSRKKPD